MENKMKQGIYLAWIVAADLNKAIKFYTEVIGMKLKEKHEEYGWAELVGEGGAMLGIASKSSKDKSDKNCDEEHCPIKPGDNAVITFTVENIESAKATMMKKGAKMLGDISEVPGHVKLQLMQDIDGNKIQLVQCTNTEKGCSCC